LRLLQLPLPHPHLRLRLRALLDPLILLLLGLAAATARRRRHHQQRLDRERNDDVGTDPAQVVQDDGKRAGFQLHGAPGQANEVLAGDEQRRTQVHVALARARSSRLAGDAHLEQHTGVRVRLRRTALQRQILAPLRHRLPLPPRELAPQTRSAQTRDLPHVNSVRFDSTRPPRPTQAAGTTHDQDLDVDPPALRVAREHVRIRQHQHRVIERAVVGARDHRARPRVVGQPQDRARRDGDVLHRCGVSAVAVAVAARGMSRRRGGREAENFWGFRADGA